MGFLEIAMMIVPQLIKLAPDALAAFESVKSFLADVDRTHNQPGGPTAADIQKLRDQHAANDALISQPNTDEV